MMSCVIEVEGVRVVLCVKGHDENISGWLPLLWRDFRHFQKNYFVRLRGKYPATFVNAMSSFLFSLAILLLCLTS